MGVLWLLMGLVAGALAGTAAGLWLGRSRLERARQLSTRARASETYAELGHLAGGLAHELKNPLSTINMNLKLLSEDLARRSDEDHRRWLRRLQGVQEETDRLRGILDDFLRYAGKVELTLQTRDLRDILGELADFFAAQAEASRVVLRVALPERPVFCPVDGDLFKQAMLNLMLNAIQAMPEGGELLLRLSGANGQAVVEVIDTGPGIPPGDLENIFRAYYSTKSGGTGLGLPMTRRILREHGGAIRVESEVGKGTRFILTLPACES